MYNVFNALALSKLRRMLQLHRTNTVVCTVVTGTTTYTGRLGYESMDVDTRVATSVTGWLFDVFSNRLSRMMSARFGATLESIGLVDQVDFVFIYMADSTVQLYDNDTVTIDSVIYTVVRRITDSVGILHAVMLKR